MAKSPARALQMVRLAQRLRTAAGAGDWQAVAAADRELATLLAQLRAGGAALPPGEEAVLGDLDLAHQEARMRCASAADQLAARMAELQAHKDGWLAYAMNSDTPDAKP